MAKRNAGPTGEGNAGNAGRPAAAKKSAGGARGGAAKKSAGGAAKKGGARKSARGGAPDLRKDLRQFVKENPEGWGHDQWQGLLHHLGQRGHDTSDPDRIGTQLERERLTSRLEGVQGVGPQRARSLVERFGTLYDLRNADVDEIARSANVPRDLAERIKGHIG